MSTPRSSDSISTDAAAATTPAKLATSHGYTVEANDGEVGHVETPLFPPAGAEPDFIVIRLEGDEPAFAVAPVQLISSIDTDGRRVQLEASRETIADLPGDIALEY